MLRRHMLATAAGLSLAVLTSTAFAQAPAAGDMAKDPAKTASTTAPAGMGEAEMRHSETTMKLGALSLATSRLAVEKAEGPKVRQFAQFEVAEQETIADVLRSMEDGDVTASVTKPGDDAVTAMLDEEGRKTLEEMQGLSGDAFSKAYVTAQIETHRKLLDAQQAYLSAGQVREHVDVAKLASGQIKEHIQILGDIQSELN